MANSDPRNEALGRIPTRPSRSEGDTTFLDLPPDVLIHIVGLLVPLDVLSVRAACKYLLVTSQERAVWFSVFQHLCERQGVIHGTFPVEEWSSSQLESACFRSQNFGKRISQNPKGIGPSTCYFVDPELLQVADHHKKDHPWAETTFTEALLAVGGRFLLTIYQYHTVSLWDLGADPEVTPPSPIVSFQPEGREFFKNPYKHLNVELGRQNSLIPWGDAFRVCLTSRDSDSSEKYKAWFYEFRPLFSPCYRLVGQLSLEGEIKAFDGRRIACYSRHGAGVWDVESGKSCHVATPNYLLKVALKGDLIILFHKLSYEVLKLPDSAFEGADEIERIDSLRYSEIFFDSAEPYGFSISRNPSKYHPVALCRILGEAPKLPFGYNLVIHFGCWNTVPDSPKLEFRSNVRTISHGGWKPYQPEMHVVGDVGFLLWYENGERTKLFCYLLKDIDPTNPKIFLEKSAGIEILETKHRIEEYRFCPISARLVTLNKGKIHLMEYYPL